MSSSDSDRDGITMLSGRRRRPIKLTLARKSGFLGMMSKKKKFAPITRTRATVKKKSMWDDSSSDEDYQPASGGGDGGSGGGDASGNDGSDDDDKLKSGDDVNADDSSSTGLSRAYTEDEIKERNDYQARVMAAMSSRVSQPQFPRHKQLAARMMDERDIDDLPRDALFPHYGSGTRHSFAKSGTQSAPTQKSYDPDSAVGRRNIQLARIEEDTRSFSLETADASRADRMQRITDETTRNFTDDRNNDDFDQTQESNVLGEGAFASIAVSSIEDDHARAAPAEKEVENVSHPAVDVHETVQTEADVVADEETAAPHQMTEEEQNKADSEGELRHLTMLIDLARSDHQTIQSSIQDIQNEVTSIHSLESLIDSLSFGDATNVIRKAVGNSYRLMQLKALQEEQSSEEQKFIKQLNAETNRPGHGAFSPVHFTEIMQKGPSANRYLNHRISSGLKELKAMDYMTLIPDDPDNEQSNIDSDEIVRAEIERIRAAYDNQIKEFLHIIAEKVPSLKTNDRYSEYISYANKRFNEAQTSIVNNIHSLRNDLVASNKLYEVKKNIESDYEQDLAADIQSSSSSSVSSDDYVASMLLEQRQAYDRAMIADVNDLLKQYTDVTGDAREKFRTLMKLTIAHVPLLKELRFTSPDKLIDKLPPINESTRAPTFGDVLELMDDRIDVVNNHITNLSTRGLIDDDPELGEFTRALVVDAVEKVWNNLSQVYDVRFKIYESKLKYDQVVRAKESIQGSSKRRREARGIELLDVIDKSSTSAQKSKHDYESDLEPDVTKQDADSLIHEIETEAENDRQDIIKASQLENRMSSLNVSTIETDIQKIDQLRLEDLQSNMYYPKDVEYNYLDRLYDLSSKRVNEGKQTPADTIVLLKLIDQKYLEFANKKSSKAKTLFSSFKVFRTGKLAPLSGTATYTVIHNRILEKIAMFQERINAEAQKNAEHSAVQAKIVNKLDQMKTRSTTKTSKSTSSSSSKSSSRK